MVKWELEWDAEALAEAHKKADRRVGAGWRKARDRFPASPQRVLDSTVHLGVDKAMQGREQASTASAEPFGARES